MSFDSIEEVRRLKKLVYPDALRSESWKLLPMTVTLISTVSEDGVPNVAPYGWVTGISTDPWYVAFSSDRGH